METEPTKLEKGLFIGWVVLLCSSFVGLLLSAVVDYSLRPDEIYKRHANEVVKILIMRAVHFPEFEGATAVEALGSGTKISKSGYVLTAAHIARPKREFLILQKNGEAYKAGVLSADTKHDIALLQPLYKTTVKNVAVIGTSLHSGEGVVHIGCPLDMTWTVTSGIASYSDENFMISDTLVGPGSSGGAVYNRNGQLVGVVSAMIVEGFMMVRTGFSVLAKIEDINKLVDGWKEVF